MDTTNISKVKDYFDMKVEKDCRKQLEEVAKNQSFQRHWPYLFASLVRAYTINGGTLESIPKCYDVPEYLLRTSPGAELDWFDMGFCTLEIHRYHYSYYITDVSIKYLCTL